MTDIVRMGTSEIMFGSGKFTTTRRYLRAGTSGAAFAVAKGKTVEMFPDGSGSAVTWRYSVNGYLVQHTGSGGSGSTFNATYTVVKIV